MSINRDILSTNADGATDWIETHSARYFQYLHPNPENLLIEDIAHGLSHICRFSGQCLEFYSVAQHSCIVHDNAPDHLKLEGLLHDASEAYISDIPRPVKTIIPQIKELEHRIQMQVSQRFKFSFPYSNQIQLLDTQLMLAEAQQLFTQQVAWWVDGLDPLDVIVTPCWTPKLAKSEFLRRFDDIMVYENDDYRKRD